MKKLFFLVIILRSLVAAAQPFEGEIIYKISVKTKFPAVSDEQWTKMIGTKQEYYTKQGKYKSVTNGTLMEWQLYSNKDNKIYAKGTSSIVVWNDGSVNNDKVIKAEIRKNAAVILGYSCDELTLTCKSGVQKYYFSSKLPVEVKLYENHKFSNWYEYLKNAGALPLKTIIETDQLVMETVATEVKPMKLDDKIFALPPNIRIEKNPN
jgi:hypothetical protein